VSATGALLIVRKVLQSLAEDGIIKIRDKISNKNEKDAK